MQPSIPWSICFCHNKIGNHPFFEVYRAVFFRCATCRQSLSLIVICFHSLSFVVTRCYSLSLVVIRCHSLSFVVTLVVTRFHWLLLDVPPFSLFIKDRHVWCKYFNVVSVDNFSIKSWSSLRFMQSYLLDMISQILVYEKLSLM